MLLRYVLKLYKGPTGLFLNRVTKYLLLTALLLSCSHKNGQHYALSGKVVALNPRDHTALVDAAAIPNFMEAMTMEYPVKSNRDFEKLHVGDKIQATVNVGDNGAYNLSDIRIGLPAR